MKGFLLIETLVYTALLAIITSVFALIYVSGMDTRSLNEGEQRVLQTSQFVERTILQRLEEASTVNAPTTGESDTLSIDAPIGAEDPVVFSVADETLYMTLGVNAPVALTADLTVEEFIVTRLGGSPASLQIEITYQATTSSGATPTLTSTIPYTFRYE
jgi:type II secretory pathway pseudopilin PulG